MREVRCGELMAAVVVACALATPARAQLPDTAPRNPVAEIGMEPAVLVHTAVGSTSSTVLAVPGGTLGYLSQVYVSLFVTPEFALEPALMYQHRSGDYSGGWFAIGTLRAAGYGQGAQNNSVYAFLETGFAGNSDTSHGDLGAGAGYRWLVADRHVALRLEGFFRRWTTSPAQTELGLALRFGVVVPRAR